MEACVNDVYFALPDAVRQVLGKVRRNLQAAFDSRGLGLSPPEAHILHLVKDEPEITPLEVSHRTGHDKAVVARKIKSMQAADLLVREQDTDDRRRWKLRLTPSGRKYCEQISAARREAHAQVFHALSTDEQKQLTQLLEKCL
jgi:DNA-binding MarR family transcriptional regulator